MSANALELVEQPGLCQAAKACHRSRHRACAGVSATTALQPSPWPGWINMW